MKKYLVEFIGTFFLVLVIGMTVIGRDPGNFLPALAIGSTLMVMIFSGGHVSGGHFNPAVTLGVWLRGRCAISDVPGYFIAQIIAGVVAAKLVIFLKGCPTVEANNPDLMRALVAEFVGTFALVYVVLNVATAKGTAGNSFYGLAIGFTVLAMAYALGNISGGAFNPAVAIGGAVMGLVKASNLWIYFVANLAAGAVAALTFKFINPEDK
jgi:aquaporin Z